MLFLNKKDLGGVRSPKKFPSIAIVVPVYNSMNTISKCVSSLKKIKYPKKIRLIFVDDCSTDGSREFLQRVKGIELVKLEKNSGKAAALSAGLCKVKEEFVICIDSDSYPEEDLLYKTLGYFDDPKVGAVTCLVLPDKSKSLVQRIQFLEYLVGFGLGNTLLSSIDSSYVVPGPMTIFRRKVFDKLGYYEAGNLAEDMEFGLRMKDNYFKIVNCHKAVVLTDTPHNIKGLFVQRDRWYRGAAFNFVRYKHLLFNKKNPDFGFFVMPFLLFTQVLIVALLIKLAVFFFKDFFVWISIVYQCFSLGGTLFIDLPSLTLPPSLLFFVVSYTAIIIYFLICFREVNYSIKPSDLFALLMLIFIYPYFITLTYSQGYLKEMIGVRVKWRRVST
jgi:cellulose synthase/poly-beta-1,6-N-acetylglucosamine synthase-like glycosyltransferase